MENSSTPISVATNTPNAPRPERVMNGGYYAAHPYFHLPRSLLDEFNMVDDDLVSEDSQADMVANHKREREPWNFLN